MTTQYSRLKTIEIKKKKLKAIKKMDVISKTSKIKRNKNKIEIKNIKFINETGHYLQQQKIKCYKH